MNFYGGEEYNKLIQDLDKKIYSKCDLTNETNKKVLNDNYSIIC